MSAKKRGWREKVEKGIYREHRVACPSSLDRKPGRRCQCPYTLVVPGDQPGKTRQVSHPGPVAEARNQRRTLLAAGTTRSPASTDDGTLNAFALTYFAAKGPILSPNTIRNRGDDYSRRIAPDLGHLQLDELTRERLQQWLISLLPRSKSQRMSEQAVATLRAMLSTAVEWGRLDHNPAFKLKVPAQPSESVPSVEKVLSQAQIEQVIAAAGTLRTETIVRAAATAGLRRGEISGLKWSDVLLDQPVLSIRRQVIEDFRVGEGHEKLEVATKSKTSRNVAISRTFAERLGKYRAQLFPDGNVDGNAYVWPGKNGGPMNGRSAYRAVERAQIRCGLVDGEGKPLSTLHGLRHSCASVWFREGFPIIMISRQLGHANPQITARIYAHLADHADLHQLAAVFDNG